MEQEVITQFIPLLHSKIGAKYVSEEKQFAFTFDFNIAPNAVLREVKLSEFVSCIYDEYPLIGVVKEIDITSKDVLIKFLHPHYPSRSYHWPSWEDLQYAGYQIPTYFAALNHLQQLLGDNIKFVSNIFSYLKGRNFGGKKICWIWWFLPKTAKLNSRQI